METQTTNTVKATRGNHQWENNAKERQISDHTRHYIEILGRIEDTYTELIYLVEATGVVFNERLDSYTEPAMNSFSAFRQEVQKLMFDNIAENLAVAKDDI